MTFFDRYIIRAMAGPFIFGVSTVIFLFLMQFVLNYLDKLVGKGLDIWIIIQLIALNLAWMVVLAVPMGVLFATLMAFGSLSAANEITVVKASGGSLVRMMMPIIIFGLILSFALFLFNDRVLPDANHKAKTLFSDIRRIKPTFSIDAGQFSTQIDGYTILARSVDSLSGMLKGVTIYDHSKNRRLNIVSADTGVFAFTPDMSKLVLDLTKGEIHQIIPGRFENYRIINFSKYKIYMKASGFTFSRTDEDIISRGDRELNIDDMQQIVDEAMGKSSEANLRIMEQLNKHYDYLAGAGQIDKPKVTNINKLSFTDKKDTSQISALRQSQKRISFLNSTIQSDIYQKKEYLFKAMKYNVEIQKKYAIPFACFIFVFVGCPLGIITRGGNFGLSAAFSLGFYIIYWACLIGGEKLADRGFLSPVMSMWLGNIVIGTIGIILTLKVNYESLSFPGSKLIGKLFRRNP